MIKSNSSFTYCAEEGKCLCAHWPYGLPVIGQLVLVGRCMVLRWSEACFLLAFIALFQDQWLAVVLLVAIVGGPGLRVLRRLARQLSRQCRPS